MGTITGTISEELQQRVDEEIGDNLSQEDLNAVFDYAIGAYLDELNSLNQQRKQDMVSLGMIEPQDSEESSDDSNNDDNSDEHSEMVFQSIAEHSQLNTQTVKEIFAAFPPVIKQRLADTDGKKALFPGLFALRAKHIPAAEARTGSNPFTGEPMAIEARPPRTFIYAIAVKHLRTELALDKE